MRGRPKEPKADRQCWPPAADSRCYIVKRRDGRTNTRVVLQLGTIAAKRTYAARRHEIWVACVYVHPWQLPSLSPTCDFCSIWWAKGLNHPCRQTLSETVELRTHIPVTHAYTYEPSCEDMHADAATRSRSPWTGSKTTTFFADRLWRSKRIN
jgi:hypothetical protein